jgi:hypothetical protein
MIIVYRAANTADAHLIRQMLEAEGIPAFVQGEYLQGAVGELPANTEIFVRVSDDNYDAARAVVAEWESAEPVVFDDDDEPAPAPAPPRLGIPAVALISLLAMVAVCAVVVMVLVRWSTGS